MLARAAGEVAAGAGVGCAPQGSRGGEAASGCRTSLWSCPPRWLGLGRRGWLPVSPGDGVEAGLRAPQIIEQQP